MTVVSARRRAHCQLMGLYLGSLCGAVEGKTGFSGAAERDAVALMSPELSDTRRV